MIAGRLGIEYYDRDLVDEVVQKIGVDRDLVERADNSGDVFYSFETKYGNRYANLSNRVIETQFEVVREMAEKSSCVLIGRSTNFILRELDNVLNIFIYAPEQIEIASIVDRQKISHARAVELHRSVENAQHARHKYITGTDRGDRHGRDIMIDSSLLGWARTAEFLTDFIREYFGIEETR